MKNLINGKFWAAILAVVFVLGTIDGLAQKKRKPAIKRTTTVKKSTVIKPTVVKPTLYTVERGQRIRVRMNELISSKTARVGDRFTTTVTEPVYSTTGVVVIPVGSTAVGRVDSVQRAKKGGDPGAIDVSFVEVKLPNGTRRTINGSLTDLNSDNAKSDNEGRASGDDRKNDKVIFIGGGAAGGAILGAAVGGGKGALIGAILGGLGGLAGERLTKGEDAEVKSGTAFGIYLNQSISLPKFGEAVSEMDESPSTTNNSGQKYIVQSGDTLAKISIKFYGTSARYLNIYEANRDRLASPSSIEVGQELIIP
jgi:LysM repeat protein